MNNVSNYRINYQYAKRYIDTEKIKIPARQLRSYVKAITDWEQKYIFSLPCGWETYRDTILWVDYDEVIEKFIDTMEGNTSYYLNPDDISNKKDYEEFINCIFPQIRKCMKQMV